MTDELIHQLVYTAGLGLARTIHIRCIYGVLGRETTKYTVINSVWFWSTLRRGLYRLQFMQLLYIPRWCLLTTHAVESSAAAAEECIRNTQHRTSTQSQRVCRILFSATIRYPYPIAILLLCKVETATQTIFEIDRGLATTSQAWRWWQHSDVIVFTDLQWQVRVPMLLPYLEELGITHVRIFVVFGVGEDRIVPAG